MSESNGRHAGGGFTVEYSSDGNSFTPIAEIVDATPPEWMVKEAKATHAASPNQSTEAKPGLSDTGKGTITLNFTEDELDNMLNLRRLIRYWRFSFPKAEGQNNAPRIDFKGFWTKIGGLKQDPDDANLIQANIEFTRSSGVPTFTKGN
jgi:hypothetical protein